MKVLMVIASMPLLLSISAFGLTTLPDKQMGNIIGQSGIPIVAGLDIDIHLDTIAWGDSDSDVKDTEDETASAGSAEFPGVNGMDDTGWVIDLMSFIADAGYVEVEPPVFYPDKYFCDIVRPLFGSNDPGITVFDKESRTSGSVRKLGSSDDGHSLGNSYSSGAQITSKGWIANGRH